MLKILILLRNLFLATLGAIGFLLLGLLFLKGSAFVIDFIHAYFYGIIFTICAILLIAISLSMAVILKKIVYEPFFNYELKRRVPEIALEHENEAKRALSKCKDMEHSLKKQKEEIELEIEKNFKILDDIAQEREKYKVEANTIIKPKEEEIAKRIKNVEEKELLLAEREKNIEAREAKYKAYIENIDSLTAKNKELRAEIQPLQSTIEIARKALASQNIDAARTALSKKKR